jgi:general secretion pathway protein A
VGKSELLLALEAFLVDVTRQGKRCLLIVDEAQNLTPRAVEELRMLSNFQFGTQALLQSFLIGQPEFRKIMQSPQMQQLRQRVIAACHIGPMDQDETQAYIEHRLKCAGSRGSPRFDAGAFEALFEASGGIPSASTRIAIAFSWPAFLNGKSRIHACRRRGSGQGDPRRDPIGAQLTEARWTTGLGGLANPQLTESGILDIDLSRLGLDASTADQAARVIADLRNGQAEQRLIRIERSMFRLERNNAAVLSLLQQLVDAVRAKQ